MFPALIDKKTATPIHRVTASALHDWLDEQPDAVGIWAKAADFQAKPGQVLLLPGELIGSAKALGGVLVGVSAPSEANDDAEVAETELWSLAALPMSLPPGAYALAVDPEDPEAANRLALGWALGSYGFHRYRKRERGPASLVWPRHADRTQVLALAEATAMARDMITTPASDMGPADIAAMAGDVAKRHDAKLRLIVGDELLTAHYPAIHAVGRASAKPPCLIDMVWTPPAAANKAKAKSKKRLPKVTLVGKGVCFDSGGLDIKSSAGMLLMKKDMGGAATVLALAQAIMATELPVRLRVLIPAVENMIDGSAMRPLDVLATRKGVTVEVGNTDAEGRLILCDALAEADGEAPDLLIDCATLTGAARVALGPDLPALFTRHDDLAASVLAAGLATADPLWRLPLWPGYRRMIDSKVADLSSTGDSPFAGAVTAALYLAEFVSPKTRWMHIDLIAWNTRPRPGRPEGGEPQTLRALYKLVKDLADANSEP